MEGFLTLIFGYFFSGVGKLPDISRILMQLVLGEDSSILGTWKIWWVEVEADFQRVAKQQLGPLKLRNNNRITSYTPEGLPSSKLT